MLSKNQIKNIVKLHRKKQRQQQQRFIVEGVKVVAEAINSDFEVEQVYCTERAKKDFLHAESVVVSEKEMSQITMLNSASPALAVVRAKKIAFGMEQIANEKVIVLDGIRDPGNLGTIIRTAEWFGFRNALLANDCVEVYNPKVLQSSMGSLFRVKCQEVSIEQLRQLKSQNRDFKLLGAGMEGNPERSLREVNCGGLVVGSEADGISSEVLSILDQVVHIEGYGEAESLNAAMAAGILMHTWVNPQS